MIKVTFTAHAKSRQFGRLGEVTQVTTARHNAPPEFAFQYSDAARLIAQGLGMGEPGASSSGDGRQHYGFARGDVVVTWEEADNLPRNIRIHEKLHHGNFLDHRDMEVPVIDARTVKALFDSSPYAYIHTAEDRISWAVHELKTTGKAEHGWSTFTVWES